VGKDARDRRCDDLICAGCNCYGRRNPDEEEQGGNEKTAANAEEAGEHAHDTAYPEKEYGVDGNLCNRQINLHRRPAGNICTLAPMLTLSRTSQTLRALHSRKLSAFFQFDPPSQ
jgi:hypothetical protein